jgi:hypothetical protein
MKKKAKNLKKETLEVLNASHLSKLKGGYCPVQPVNPPGHPKI